MAAQVATFPEKYGRVPHLVVILVGEDPGSVSYVTGKAKASEAYICKNSMSKEYCILRFWVDMSFSTWFTSF